MSKSWFDGVANDNILTRAGDYWSADNAKFDATNPTFLEKVGRSVNPMTAFGSAMGQMHDAASQGDLLSMALTAVGAVPAFGVMKPIPKAMFTSRQLNSWGGTALELARNTGTQTLTDSLQSWIKEHNK